MSKVTLKIIPEACGIEQQYVKEFDISEVYSFLTIARNEGFKRLPSRVIFKTTDGTIYKTQMETGEFAKLFPDAIGN